MSVSRPARTGLKAAFAAAGAVALMSTGVAFAASGHAPWSGATAGPAASTHRADPTHPTHPVDPSDGPTDGTSQSTGPNAHAFGGLCRAYLAGNKAERGKALESPAFVALVTAAGGADNVAAFCSAESTAPSDGESTDPADGEASPTHPAHPTHPAKPTQAASPTRPALPTQAASPTHPTHPTHPAHPSGKPSNTSHPTH